MKLETPTLTNGVDIARLHETAEAVKGSPDLGQFTFCIENRWIDGGSNQSEVKSFYGCGQTFSHKTNFKLKAGEPEALLGNDDAANPVEILLHALASCVTTSMVYHAAARGIAIEEIETSLDGDLDLQGFLGLNPSVRNGYQQIRFKMRVKADVSDEKLQELTSLGPMFSPVFDTLTKGVPISVSSERMR